MDKVADVAEMIQDDEIFRRLNEVPGLGSGGEGDCGRFLRLSVILRASSSRRGVGRLRRR